MEKVGAVGIAAAILLAGAGVVVGILWGPLGFIGVALGLIALAGVKQANAAEPFRCEPGELYAMNVMVSGVEYWFPVYEMFKQAGQQFGCETAYTGTPEYDVNKQIASFDQALAQKPAGILVHPMNSDPFIEPINRATDQGTAVVTFAADWSFGFDVGMSFLEIHGPVPRLREEGVITRAHEFLKRLQPHQPYRRTNWTLTIGRRLDVSTELYPEWGPDRQMIQLVDDRTFGELVHLRVEVQHLIRLPESGAILFLIRTYLLPFEQLATIDPWRLRTAEVLAELPEDLADYKGIIKYRDRAAAWLRSAKGAR
jgi:hypothetical protein